MLETGSLHVRPSAGLPGSSSPPWLQRCPSRCMVTFLKEKTIQRQTRHRSRSFRHVKVIENTSLRLCSTCVPLRKNCRSQGVWPAGAELRFHVLHAGNRPSASRCKSMQRCPNLGARFWLHPAGALPGSLLSTGNPGQMPWKKLLTTWYEWVDFRTCRLTVLPEGARRQSPPVLSIGIAAS